MKCPKCKATMVAKVATTTVVLICYCTASQLRAESVGHEHLPDVHQAFRTDTTVPPTVARITTPQPGATFTSGSVFYGSLTLIPPPSSTWRA